MEETQLKGERLQRTLARVGYGSRRSVEDLIRQERVRINGRVAVLGDRVDPASDRITVDGALVPTNPELRHFAFNKPRGVTTTLRDPHAKRSLAEFLPPGPRVFPVGRLDRDSEGLLLLMNDGELGTRLQHARFGVEKEYLVEVEGRLTQSALRRLTEGVQLDDGLAKALKAHRLSRVRGRSSVFVVMGEGRKRQVRRMLSAVGFPVTRLVRVRLGPIRLAGLPPGKVRRLEPTEVVELYRATGLDASAVGRPKARRSK
ncbi:MAG: rRNA pseudouridine synthase [Actinomycetota bacterium]|nr:rRNA pseudouridine synthase [Actinomycetota bacterium]